MAENTAFSRHIATGGDRQNNEIQILRAFAIIAVIFIHNNTTGIAQVINRQWINFPVALFIFLSGYLTQYNEGEWLSLYKRRIPRVAVPYMIWTIIYWILLSPSRGILFCLLTGKAAIHLYYIVVYVQFVLLTPFIYRLGKSKFAKFGWIVSPLFIVCVRYLLYIYGGG